MKVSKYTSQEEKMAAFAKALGHPARIAILNFLAQQDQCFFGDIEEILPIAKATVSQHLTELKNVGLIQGNISGARTKYCINCEAWQEARTLFDQLFICCKKGSSCCNS